MEGISMDREPKVEILKGSDVRQQVARIRADFERYDKHLLEAFSKIHDKVSVFASGDMDLESSFKCILSVEYMVVSYRSMLMRELLQVSRILDVSQTPAVSSVFTQRKNDLLVHIQRLNELVNDFNVIQRTVHAYRSYSI